MSCGWPRTPARTTWSATRVQIIDSPPPIELILLAGSTLVEEIPDERWTELFAGLRSNRDGPLFR